MYKVLVINPYITDFKLYDEWMHPSGLYFLIDCLKRNGIQTYYFNCLKQVSKPKKHGTGSFMSLEIKKPSLYKNIKRKYKLYGRPQSELINFLSDIDDPDLVCIGTMMTYWAPGVIQTIKIIKEQLPNVPVIIGGIAARLFSHYFKNRLPGCITSDSILTTNRINLPQPVHSALKALSKPTSLLGGLECLDHATHGPVLLSFGCPMKCSYCASRVLQKDFYHRSIKTTIREILYLNERFGVSDFAFYDDALLVKPDQVLIPFLKKINEYKIPFRFHTPNGLHLQFITEEISDLMKENGFKTIRLGFESGSKKYADDTNYKSGFDMLEKKVSILQKSGFDKNDIGVYIMGGLKDQKPLEMLKEMEYAGSLGIKIKPVFLSPVPHTELFKYYSHFFPQIKSDPLWHNDTFFITSLAQWDFDSVEMIRKKSREINQVNSCRPAGNL